MIKYTPHTQAAVSVAERNEKIQSMHNELNTLFSSLQEILPVGRLMLQYSQANSKQIRMKEQINFLTKVLEDLHQPNTRFSNDTNDQIYDFFHEQAMINNNYTNKLFKRINKAEIDNITHTINFKLTQINSESDLNQEAADEILFSYIEKVKTLNKEYEQQYCTNFEYNTYLKLIEEEEARYEKFKQETNDTIQNLQNEIDKKQNELQSHIRKLEKLKASEQKMVKDFAEKINMLKEVNDYLHEKANEFHDEKLLNALCELFSALQNPNSTDSEIKLILKSISHLANLKPIQNNEQPSQMQQQQPQMQQQQPQMQQQQPQMQQQQPQMQQQQPQMQQQQPQMQQQQPQMQQQQPQMQQQQPQMQQQQLQMQQQQMQQQQLQMQQPRIQPPPPMQHQQLSIDQLNALSIHDKLAILKQKFSENQKNFK